MANKRFIVRHGLDNSGDNSVVNTITNVAEPVNNSDAATKYYVDTHTSGGTVTSVTATSPVESTGGTAPVISLGTGANGQLVIGTGTGFTKSTLTAGTGVSIANASGSVTISATGSGGDVVGPASATDNAVVRFDGTTGKIIQNSTATLSDGGIMIVTELDTDSIKSATANSPIVIAPDGTGDVHLNADSVRIGDNNANATIATNGTGDLIITTNEGSAVEGVIRLYDGANGNITLTPNGTGQVQVGSDQVVTLTASQTLTNKTLSSNSVWNGNVIGSAYGGAGTVNGILKANGSGTVSAASAGTDYVTSVSVTSPVSNTGTSANPTIALGSGYGDTQNPYASKTANYFLASPNGSAGVPTFRAIVAADIPTLNQNTTGNAATASALQTARNINGVSFNGTADITVTAAAGTLTGTTLASGVTASSLTSVGTLTGLTVSGTTSLATSSGYSQIGTTSNYTSSKLQVYGNIDLVNTSTSQYIRFYDGTTFNGGLGTDNWVGGSSANLTLVSNGDTVFRTAGGTERMRITSGGDVGLGTSSPAYKLDVNGSVRFATGATGTPIILQTGSSTQATLRFGSSGQVYSINGGEDYTAMIFNTNGSERMRIDSSGNVGIGTSSPSNKLHIAAAGLDISGGIAVDGSTMQGIRLQNTVNTNSSLGIWFGTNNVHWCGISGQRSNYASTWGTDLRFYTHEDATSNLTYSTERMRITSDGSVGLGTSSPATKLTVNSGSSGADSARFTDGVNSTLLVRHSSGGIASLDAYSTFTFMVSGSERMRIDSSGNVGIGTSSPSAKLHVANGGSNAQATFVGTTGSPYITVVANSGTTILGNESNGGWVGTTGSQAFVFKTNDTERMRIDSSGNLGIGTSSPTTYGLSGKHLDVSGGASYSFIHCNTTTVKSFLASNESALLTALFTFSNHPLTLGTNNTERMRIDSSGNVGIGTASPTNKLQVNGVMVGNNAAGSYTKGFGGIFVTNSAPTTGNAGDHHYVY